MYKRFMFLAAILLPLLTIAPSQAQSPPEAPQNLTVTQMMTSAKLDWDAVGAAMGYKVYKAVDTLPFHLIAGVSMNHFIDAFVGPGHIYRYYVTAFNFGGESQPSNDVVFILNAPPDSFPHGFIAGKVLDDTTGLPVRDVRIRFYRPFGNMYFREARTDSFGNYKTPLDTGLFLVYATKWTYIPEWYDNAVKREFATPVVVTKGETAHANFGLTRVEPPEPPRLVPVSGTVIDSTTGLPMKDAFVVIMRTHRQVALMLNYEGNLFGSRNETFTIPGFGTFAGVVRATRTDTNGAYSFLVPDSLSYILMAYTHGYLPEFYNNKRTPFDADRVLVQGGVSGINFDLIPNPLVQNSVAGSVRNQEGVGVRSKVVLFVNTNRGPYPVRFALTDSLGSFSVDHLFAGLYYAKAVPVAPYAPAWYDTDSCGVHCWVNADTFRVTGDITGIDICVKPLLLAGFATIGGTVSESGSGSTLQAATVYALAAATGEVSGYDITENDGSFRIEGLAPGAYTLLVDKEGYSASQVPAAVDGTNDYTLADANVSLDPVVLSVETTGEGVPASYSLGQNYPNPFNPATEISFGTPVAGRISVTVYNLLGQLVATLVEADLPAGSYTLRWQGTDGEGKAVTSGVYFYRMTAQSKNGATYASIRKMLLVK